MSSKSKTTADGVDLPVLKQPVGVDKEADRQAVKDSLMDSDGFEDIWGEQP